MRKYKSMLENCNEASDGIQAIVKTKDYINKVQNNIKNADEIIADIDMEFSRATSITNKKDMIFLWTAVALQCVRIYLLENITQRTGDQEAANKVKGAIKEHSNRKHFYYNPSLEEIISNPVPFDANRGSNGVLKGGGKLGHRATAIGHDPILGLIFGTANIATSTITLWNMNSYHIVTKLGKSGNGEVPIDHFGENAKTELVLKKTQEKIMGNWNSKIIVATSLMKEVVHLRSDIYSKNSLPLPFISTINPKIASDLAEFGMDAAGVEKLSLQSGFAILINVIIQMLHQLFNIENDEVDRQLYNVRTKKIIMLSNTIAESIDIVAVASGCIAGVLSDNPELVVKSAKKIDIGGIIVAVQQIYSCNKLQEQIRREFLERKLYTIFVDKM